MRWSGKFFRPGQSGNVAEMFRNLDPGFDGSKSKRLHKERVMPIINIQPQLTEEDWDYLNEERSKPHPPAKPTPHQTPNWILDQIDKYNL